MRRRLLYLCLRAWPPCCRSVVGVVVFLDVSGSGRIREVRQRFAGQQVTGHQVESFMSACVDARVPLLLFDLFRASPCWLAALWPLQVQANLVAFRVMPMLPNGVSVRDSRWRGQPVFRSLCARSPGCSCFCLRFDFQVTVSVRGSQGPGFLVLAFSVRTLKSSGVPARRVPAGGLPRGHVVFGL